VGPSLDFDLLGDAPKPAAPAEDPSLRTRRKMLNLHQGLGIGLLALQVASTVTGQLNYNDKFGTANTGKYKATHQVIVWTNVAAFAAVGGIALFAPRDKTAPDRGYGRTTIHKVCMAIATAGMVAQGVLGYQTAQREGYLDKETYGKAHLVVGYTTLAAMLVGVGALVL
jgi:quinol-cytochrome oxidoreductase complex cytochrome b subunit